MLATALTLIAVGVLISAIALVAWPFDFAVAVRPGWHITVFPPPAFAGVLLMLGGAVALAASHLWR